MRLDQPRLQKGPVIGKLIVVGQDSVNYLLIPLALKPQVPGFALGRGPVGSDLLSAGVERWVDVDKLKAFVWQGFQCAKVLRIDNLIGSHNKKD